jgi:hypothetical protein
MPRIPATWGEKIEALQVLGLIQHHPKKKRRNLETDTHRENKSR